jgi:hypothetical protein
VNDFSLPGVLAAPTVWVSAAPVGALDAMTTIVPVPTDTLADVSIPLARPSAIALVFGALVQPVVTNPARGQVVVFATKAANGLPFAGESVTAAGAEVVAYSSAGSWTDAIGVTDPSGLALIGNVPAGALPGTLVALDFSGVIAATLAVRVASGATTVVRVAL